MIATDLVVCPKGGSGKTLLSATLVDVYLRGGHDVLVVDADDANRSISRIYPRCAPGRVQVERCNLAMAAGWGRMIDAIGRQSGPVVIDTGGRSQPYVDQAVQDGSFAQLAEVRPLRTWFIVTDDGETLEQVWMYADGVPSHTIVTAANVRQVGRERVAGALDAVTVSYWDQLSANPDPAVVRVRKDLERHVVRDIVIPPLVARAATLVGTAKLDLAAVVARLDASHDPQDVEAATATREWRALMYSRCRAVMSAEAPTVHARPDVGEVLESMMPTAPVTVAATPPSALLSMLTPVPPMAPEPAPIGVSSAESPGDAASLAVDAGGGGSCLPSATVVVDGWFEEEATARGLGGEMRVVAGALDVLRGLEVQLDEAGRRAAALTGSRDHGWADPVRRMTRADLAAFAQMLFERAGSDPRTVLGDVLYHALATLTAGVEAPVQELSERTRELFQRFNPDWDASPELTKLRDELRAARTPALAAEHRAMTQGHSAFSEFASLVDASRSWALAVPDDDLYWVSPDHRGALGSAAGYACLAILSREAYATALEERTQNEFRSAGVAGVVDDAGGDGAPALPPGEGPAFVGGLVLPHGVAPAPRPSADGAMRFEVRPHADSALVGYGAGTFANAARRLIAATGAALSAVCIVAPSAQHRVLASAETPGLVFVSSGARGRDWLARLAACASVPETAS